MSVGFGSVRLIGFHSGGVECVRVHGERVYSSGFDSCLKSWNPREGVDWLRAPEDPASAVPPGHCLRRFEPVDLYPGTYLREKHVLAFEFFNQGTRIACGLRNGRVEVIEASSGELVRELRVPSGMPGEFAYGFHSVAVWQDRFIAATNGAYAMVWSAADGRLHWSAPVTGGNAVLFAGGQLLVQGWEPWFRGAKFNDGQAPLSTELSWPGVWGNLVTSKFAPTGAPVHLLLSMVGLDAVDAHNFTEAVTDPGIEMDWDDAFHKQKLADRATHPESDVAPAEEPQESGFLTGVHLRESKVLWQGKTAGRIHDFQFLSEGTRVVSCGDEGRLELWNFEQTTPLASLDLARLAEGVSRAHPHVPHPGPDLHKVDFYASHTLHTLSASPTGRFVAVGTAGGAVLVVELT